MSIRFLPAALIAVLIALMAVGGAALAFGLDGTNSEKTDDLLERAATELGVEPQVLKDALAQARSEISAEQRQKILDDLVEAEVITQAQADEAAAWLDQQPDAVEKLMQPERLLRLAVSSVATNVIRDIELHFPPVLGDDVTEKMAEILGVDADALADALQSARQDQAEDARVDALNQLIDQLVTDGNITASEGEEIKTWLSAMPEWLNDNGLLLRLMGANFGRGFGNGFSIFGPSATFGFGGGFRGEPHRAVPELRELEELRRGHSSPFIVPGDWPEGRFKFPRFDIRPRIAPDEDGEVNPEFYYFHGGPDGKFFFDGQFPEDFDHLFDGLEGDFDFGDLEDLFEQFAPFRFGPPPASGSSAGPADQDPEPATAESAA